MTSTTVYTRAMSALQPARDFRAALDTMISSAEAELGAAHDAFDMDDPANAEKSAQAVLRAITISNQFANTRDVKVFSLEHGTADQVFRQLQQAAALPKQIADQDRQRKAVADAAAQKAAADAALLAQQKAAYDATTLEWKQRLGLPV